MNMRALHNSFKAAALLMLALGMFSGCESTGGGGSADAGFYYGTGLYDPWYYGGYWDDPDIIVTPPPGRPENPPPRPTHPIALPPASAPRPTPLPSIPSAPRPMPMGGGRR